jgi:hypothetical protein
MQADFIVFDIVTGQGRQRKIPPNSETHNIPTELTTLRIMTPHGLKVSIIVTVEI